MTLLFELCLILVMIGCSAVFAAYEMSLASISAARLHVLAARKIKGAAEAVFMKANMEASLAVVQLGLTIAGAVAAAAGGLSAADMLSPVLVDKWNLPKVVADIFSLLFVVIPLSSVTVVFGELVPKVFALNKREKVCLALSPAMNGLYRWFLPVIRTFELVVKWLVARLLHQMDSRTSDDDPGLHELHAAAALARTSRLIGAQQEKIVVSAAQLSSRHIHDISIPIRDVSTVNLSASLSQALLRVHMDMHTRFPVVEKDDDPQTVVGYINFKDIMAALKLNPADPSVRGIVRPITKIDGNQSVSLALEMMMREKMHIAIITGKDGLVTGLVTLEDIIEELVGEIEDEFDRMPTQVHPFAGGWIMGGGVPMSVVAQQAGAAFTGSTEGRLMDWCELRGLDVNRGGEAVEADGLRVTARKFRRKKVSEAAVALAEKG